MLIGTPKSQRITLRMVATPSSFGVEPIAGTRVPVVADSALPTVVNLRL